MNRGFVLVLLFVAGACSTATEGAATPTSPAVSPTAEVGPSPSYPDTATPGLPATSTPSATNATSPPQATASVQAPTIDATAISPVNATNLLELGRIGILPNGFYSLSPDWRYLALVQYGSSGQYDQSLTLWDASSLLGRGTELALLAENIPIGREGSLNSTILFLPGMRSLAVFTYCPSCPETMMTEIYSIDPSSDYAAVFPMDVGGLPVVFVTAGGLFKDVAPYVDGVAALDWEGIKLLNVWSGETLSIDLPQAPWSVRLEVHPGGQLAAVLNPDGIQIFDIYAEQAIASIPWLEDNRLWSVAFSPDGRFLATADDRDVLVRSGSTYELIHAIPYSGERPVLTFSPDGSILAARGGATEIVLWNTETGQVVSRFAGASNLTFSPDGSLILVQRERDLVLWGLP